MRNPWQYSRELPATYVNWEAETLAKGRKDLLLKLLALKFGPLSATDFEHARTAPAHEVECWAERILTATTLKEVFA